MSDLNKAIALMLENPGVYGNRGIVYMRTNQYLKAVDDFCQAIRRNPDAGQNYANRGTCELKLAI